MAKAETLETIKARWIKQYETKEKEKNEYLEKAEEAKARMDQAIEAADKAYKNADMKAYYKAQEERRFNEDAAKMYADKAAEIEREPYITRKEFNEIFADVKAYFDMFVANDQERLADVAMKMVEIRDRESEELKKCNDFIRFAQLNLLKATNGLWTEDGSLISFKVKELTNYSGLNFVNFVCNHYFVEDLIKEKMATKKGV